MNIHQPLFAATRDWFSAHRALRAPARGPGLRTEHNGMSAGRLTGTVRIISPHEKRLRGVSQIECGETISTSGKFVGIRGKFPEVGSTGNILKMEYSKWIVDMGEKKKNFLKKNVRKNSSGHFCRTLAPGLPGPWSQNPAQGRAPPGGRAPGLGPQVGGGVAVQGSR